MKITFSSLLLGLLFITSCQEDPKLRALAQEKEVQKKEVIFKNISNGWNFSVQPNNETSRSLTNSWGEWRVLLNELAQKPKSSLGAFQQKAKTLSKRATDLNNNVPIEFNIPEIKSRINALCTKINAINLYSTSLICISVTHLSYTWDLMYYLIHFSFIESINGMYGTCIHRSGVSSCCGKLGVSYSF
jgi:hypothetical protein